MIEIIWGLLILPYQFLQIIGYRLAGVQCHRKFGHFGVEPLKPVTQAQHLVGKFFPLFILILGGVLQVITTVYLSRLYQDSKPLIPLLFVLFSTPPLALYLHYARFDIQNRQSR